MLEKQVKFDGSVRYTYAIFYQVAHGKVGQVVLHGVQPRRHQQPCHVPRVGIHFLLEYFSEPQSLNIESQWHTTRRTRKRRSKRRCDVKINYCAAGCF